MFDTYGKSGWFKNGIPYNRLGNGPRPLVVFQGLLFENKPQPGMVVDAYNFLGEDYTVFVVMRKPGMPVGYSLKDMANDYAEMVREVFGGPVDVIGVSTGGSIVQHFAADHPDLIRKLVIQSSAYILSDFSKALQLKVADQARNRHWVEAYYTMMEMMFPRQGVSGLLIKPIVLFISLIMGVFSAPKKPNDLVVTVEAEDQHDFRNRLSEIKAPTLVVAGMEDPFYSEGLFRETAAGILNARLILYPNMGHPASGKQFERDVLAFLRED